MVMELWQLGTARGPGLLLVTQAGLASPWSHSPAVPTAEPGPALAAPAGASHKVTTVGDLPPHLSVAVTKMPPRHPRR